jgi:hypothetical protein
MGLEALIDVKHECIPMSLLIGEEHANEVASQEERAGVFRNENKTPV